MKKIIKIKKMKKKMKKNNIYKLIKNKKVY